MDRYDEKRFHNRYCPENKIGTHFVYEITTRLTFHQFDKTTNKPYGDEYSVWLKNISVEGLCFSFDEELEQGQKLALKLLIPEDANPIYLLGEVKWANLVETTLHGQEKYDVGVKLLAINEHPVQDSVYFDEQYNVEWSDVLEIIFGRYRIIMQDRKNLRRKEEK